MWWMTLMGAVAAEAPEGSPFADLPYFHQTRLRNQKRFEAAYPEGVSPEAQAERHRCVVWVKIGADGRPAEVRIVEEFAGNGCTAPFQASARDALGQWKWKPTKVGGEKSMVHTQVAVVFDPRRSAPVIDTSLEANPVPEPVKQPKRPQ